MAKTLEELLETRDHMLINPSSSGNAEHVNAFIQASGWPGEIFIQLDSTSANGATILTLGKDGETISEFPNKVDIIKLLQESALEISAVTPSSTNIRDEYSLVDPNGNVHGVNIKIYKDSSLYNAYLGHVDDTITSSSDPTVVPGTGDTALCFIYLKADGTYELVAVDVESFLQESEFKSGVTVDNGSHIVHGVVDPASESFLTVGGDGFKLSGVQDAIDAAKNALNADVTGKSADDHVSVEVVEESGVVTSVVVTTEDIASSAVTVELETNLNALSGVVIENEEIVAGALNDLDEKIDYVSGVVATLSSVTDDIEELSGSVMTIETNLNAVSGNVVALSGVVETVSGDVVTVETNLNAVSGNVVALSGAVETIEDNLDAVSGNVVALSGAVETIEDNLDAVSGAVISNERIVSGALNELNDRLDAVSGNVGTLSGNVESLSGAVQSAISNLTLTGVDDGKYVHVDVSTAATGTTIGVSGVTKEISASTSNDTGIADAYNVKQYAISQISGATATETANVQVVTDANGVKQLDFSKISINCGTF